MTNTATANVEASVASFTADLRRSAPEAGGSDLRRQRPLRCAGARRAGDEEQGKQGNAGVEWVHEAHRI